MWAYGKNNGHAFLAMFYPVMSKRKEKAYYGIIRFLAMLWSPSNQWIGVNWIKKSVSSVILKYYDMTSTDTFPEI